MGNKNFTGQGEFADTTSELNRSEFIIRQMMNRMATATLVMVKAVGEKTVTVQPMVAQLDGAGNAIPHGNINNMPFHAPGAGGSAIVMKPKVGDIGIAIFCHNDISSVKKNKKPSNPGSRRRFDWADGLFIGGFLGGTPTQTIAIDDDDGITITAAPGKKITLVSDTKVEFTGDAKITGNLEVTGDATIGGKAFSTHHHSGVTTGAGNTGPPA